ncbi:4959_t:CDS:2, partial [Dentiscutata erythropus]
IILDNRGIGESTVASYDDPITIELMAQDTIALIKHLGIKRFNLFGTNMGARIAFAVASDLPSDLKLEKLVVSTCAPRIDTSSEAFQGFEKLYKVKSLPFATTIQEQKDQLLGGKHEKDLAKYLLEHPDKLERVAEMMINTNPKRPTELLKRQWEAIKTYDLFSRLKEIKVPTLVFYGENDVFFTIKDAELLDQELPNSKLYRISNAGYA